jgi:hypothetical protein
MTTKAAILQAAKQFFPPRLNKHLRVLKQQGEWMVVMSAQRVSYAGGRIVVPVGEMVFLAVKSPKAVYGYDFFQVER